MTSGLVYRLPRCTVDGCTEPESTLVPRRCAKHTAGITVTISSTHAVYDHRFTECGIQYARGSYKRDTSALPVDCAYCLEELALHYVSPNAAPAARQ